MQRKFVHDISHFVVAKLTTQIIQHKLCLFYTSENLFDDCDDLINSNIKHDLNSLNDHL